MSVFIEARTEPFEGYRRSLQSSMWGDQTTDHPVRRPTRGIQVKENTYAVIRIMGPDGEFLSVIDAAGEEMISTTGEQTTTHYTNFFVQSVTEERHEKQQIVDTFGDSFIFFFGEAPRIKTVSGLLLNTADFNWRSEFWENYERYFRGTKLVELGARLYLIYDDIVVEGYMISAQAQDNTSQPHVIPFSFQMFVTGYSSLSLLGDPDYPRNDADYAQISSYERALSQWYQGRNLQRELSTQAVLEANRRAVSKVGLGGSLIDKIRANIIDGGDPSITGFVARAQQATQLAPNPFGPTLQPNPFVSPTANRSLPLRSTFRDNVDEFIGMPEPSPAELAEPLSMADQWLEMDRNVDLSVSGLFSEFDASTHPTYWDLMGRAGRAMTEMIAGGALRGIGVRINRGLLVGAATIRNTPAVARDVPFGLIAVAGTMV